MKGKKTQLDFISVKCMLHLVYFKGQLQGEFLDYWILVAKKAGTSVKDKVRTLLKIIHGLYFQNRDEVANAIYDRLGISGELDLGRHPL